MFDHEAVLNDGAGNTDHVGFLESISAHHIAGNLPRDDHHRDRVHISGGNTGDGIGRARAGGDQHHTGLAGGTRIAVGHVSSSLLMTNKDMRNFLFLEQRIIDVQQGAARIAVDVLNAFVAQEADDHFSAG